MKIIIILKKIIILHVQTTILLISYNKVILILIKTCNNSNNNYIYNNNNNNSYKSKSFIYIKVLSKLLISNISTALMKINLLKNEKKKMIRSRFFLRIAIRANLCKC